MRQTDREEKRNQDKGIGAGTAQVKDAQRDVTKDVQHMPRHWQESGGRGEAGDQTPPDLDTREVARGNQYGRAGRIASRQVREELTEHGQQPPPQRRDNEQLPKRPGERESDHPTPDKPR